MATVVLDLLDKTLSKEEAEMLAHPAVGGVILFARNYDSPQQLKDLSKEIRLSRKKPLLISVDQEGGRVQRFKEGFTPIPSMGKIGERYSQSPEEALILAESAGFLMASELLAHGVDLSFAPVLDLNEEICPAIGDRSFHQQPEIVIVLALAVMKGMKKAGMSACGKHFPGHGSVNIDSHLDLPKDHRSFDDIMKKDLRPFTALIQAGIAALMPAHIIFSKVDDKPVGFSRHWLQTILRKQLGFQGTIVSDDLNMEGAAIAGNYAERAIAALSSGCDIILICNNRKGAIEILDHLPATFFSTDEKIKNLYGKFQEDFHSLRNSSTWKTHYEQLKGHL